MNVLNGLGTFVLPENCGEQVVSAPEVGAQRWSPVLADVHRRTFDFFWECTNHATGLTPDRWPSDSPCSVAAVGFALNAYITGVECQYIPRELAAERVRNTLKTFLDGRQGPDAEGCIGFKGFFYHFLNGQGSRNGDCEVSTVDSAILFLGALTAAGFFDRADDVEQDIREIAAKLYERAEWTFFGRPNGAIGMGWRPEEGQLQWCWEGYNESMLVYLLAMASPTFPTPGHGWQAWCSTYHRTWGEHFGETHLGFSPLFGHQYSHVWYDFRDLADQFMRSQGLDYFENSIRATLAQRNYAISNPSGFAGYGPDIWGLTACDGPGEFEYRDQRLTIMCKGYSARGAGVPGPDNFDDGTLAPSAAIGSINFTPELSIKVVEAMIAQYGPSIYGRFGFFNAFNPSLTDRGQAGQPWVAPDYLGIENGLILSMLENYRSGLIWRITTKSPTAATIKRGLKAAGFTTTGPLGIWLEEML